MTRRSRAALLLLVVSAWGCGRLGFAAFGDPGSSESGDAGIPIVAATDAAAGTSVDAAFAPTEDGSRLQMDGGAIGEGGVVGVDGGTGPGTPSCVDGVQNGDEAGVDCGGSRCAQCGSGCATDLAGGYFCDGVESLPGAWTYNAQATREQTTVYSGSASARFAATTTSWGDLGRTSIPNAPTSGSIYFRGYFRVASGGTFSRMQVLSFGSTDAPPGGRFHRVGFFVEDGGYSLYNGPTRDTFSSDPATVPRDRWLCVQVEVVVAPSAGSLRLVIDGAPQIFRSGINTMAFQGYDFVNVGTIAPEGVAGTVVLYVDDIALGDSAISC